VLWRALKMRSGGPLWFAGALAGARDV
jgi:hypothetical protein